MQCHNSQSAFFLDYNINITSSQRISTKAGRQISVLAAKCLLFLVRISPNCFLLTRLVWHRRHHHNLLWFSDGHVPQPCTIRHVLHTCNDHKLLHLHAHRNSHFKQQWSHSHFNNIAGLHWCSTDFTQLNDINICQYQTKSQPPIVISSMTEIPILMSQLLTDTNDRQTEYGTAFGTASSMVLTHLEQYQLNQAQLRNRHILNYAAVRDANNKATCNNVFSTYINHNKKWMCGGVDDLGRQLGHLTDLHWLQEVHVLNTNHCCDTRLYSQQWTIAATHACTRNNALTSRAQYEPLLRHTPVLTTMHSHHVLNMNHCCDTRLYSQQCTHITCSIWTIAATHACTHNNEPLLRHAPVLALASTYTPLHGTTICNISHSYPPKPSEQSESSF